MSLGELKKILDNVVDDTNKIVIESKQLYGGHMFILP